MNICRTATIACFSLFVTALVTNSYAAPFPPLNSPATTQSLPGKLVWADLFTSDPAGAARFYCALLGWTATTIDQKGNAYTVFSNGGRPVAGLAPFSRPRAGRPSRWVGYLSVADMNSTIAHVSKNGGAVRAPAKRFPDRGYQAIIADNDGNPIGLLQSSSGDPADDETRLGDWNWFEFYAKDPKATSSFCHEVLGYDVPPDPNTGGKTEFLLVSGGINRGGIAPLPGDAGSDARPSWLGVLRVGNIDEALAKVPGLGGEVLVAPRSPEFGSRFAIILDPTGGTVGLVQYLDNANPANAK